MKIGLTKSGRITAAECKVTQRGGAYAGYGLVTILYAGALLHGLYDIPAIKYDGYRVYANLPHAGRCAATARSMCAMRLNACSTA